MPAPTARDKETRELIQRLQAERDRRRKLRVLLGCIAGAVAVALLVAVVILVMRGSGDETGAGSTSMSSPGEVTSVATSAGVTTTAGSTTAGGATVGSNSTATTGATTTARSASTSSSTTTTLAPSTTTTVAHPTGIVVVIDPGHQAKADSGQEPVGPGSSETKDRVSSGTAGVVTGIPESELVLTVGLKLRDALVANGIQVVMTRTTQDVDLSNKERAEIANNAHADLFVRIHADGSEDASMAGIHVLYPASIKGWTDDIAAASKRAAELAQKELIAATGARDRGIDARSDLSGFNWSDVPVILPEIGFMTNAAEDRLLATSGYQDKIVQGLTKAILTFLGVG